MQKIASLVTSCHIGAELSSYFSAQIKNRFCAYFQSSRSTTDNTMTRTRAVTTLLVILCVALLSEAIVKYAHPRDIFFVADFKTIY